ncbi:MAG: hypothetical protein E7406_01140 [Ruminococcaceae bacterium]|nr:hypothetical protein [Oscillospiraceae bacterium]
MQNPNALIAMAQVSGSSNNPYSVFCEYIKYCMAINPTELMTITELINSISDQFGIHLPYNVTLQCMQILSKFGYVSIQNKCYHRDGDFDIRAFEKERDDYRSVENTLISGLIEYGNRYGHTWTTDEARKLLISVLDRRGIAFDIFLKNDVSEEITDVELLEAEDIEIIEDNDIENDNSRMEQINNQPIYEDLFFVGKFIQATLNTQGSMRDYLIKVCQGLMLCSAAYQLPSSDSGVVFDSITDTSFFFDTKLLLRFLGCAGQAAVEAAKELVDLIQTNGGKIYYYAQTLEEMNRAFEKAIRSLQKNQPPYDEDMRLFALKNKNSIDVLYSKKTTIEKELSSHKIFKRANETFDEKSRLQFGFDRLDLQQYMQTHLSWEPKTVENDALAIWETHMKRSGNYSEYCGTKDKLPVFVTTNTKLIGIVLSYKENRANTTNLHGWKSNRLPVISDVRLTCRLWNPSMNQERLPVLYLTANAVAAQRPTQKYINRIKDVVEQIQKSTPEYSSICLAAYFDDKVTDTILNATVGLEENFEIGKLASTIDEVIEFKAREQEKETAKYKQECDVLTKEREVARQKTIDGAVSSHIDHLGIKGFFLWLTLHWDTIFMCVFLIISALASFLDKLITGVLLFVVVLIIQSIEKFALSNWLKKKILNLVLNSTKETYKNKISKNLRGNELNFKDEIISQCIERTKLFKKCEDVLNK